MWLIWRPIFSWDSLCPIEFADPFGLVVVMPLATQPVTLDEIMSEKPDDYPDITSEIKPANYGRIKGHLLALDYGLPDAKVIRQRRAYYAEHLMRPK